MAYLTYQGKMVQQNQKYVIKTTPPIPAAEMTTTKVGNFSMTLNGTGPVSVDWGNGDVSTATLSGYTNFIHNFTSGGNIAINNMSGITYMSVASQDLTSLSISNEAVNLVDLTAYGNAITSFTTHPEWVSLQNLNLNQSDLSTIVTYPEWVSLKYLRLEGNLLSGGITLRPEWVDLEEIQLGNNGLSSLTTYAAWTKLKTLGIAANPLLTSIATHSTWTLLETIMAYNCQLTSFNTYSSWNKLDNFNISNNQLTTLNAHSTWTLLTYINAGGNAITLDTDINNILIALDAALLATGDSIFIMGGTNAAPTGAGITAKNNLIGRGAGVYTN